jgi:hypothetical protein
VCKNIILLFHLKILQKILKQLAFFDCYGKTISWRVLSYLEICASHMSSSQMGEFSGRSIMIGFSRREKLFFDFRLLFEKVLFYLDLTLFLENTSY